MNKQIPNMTGLDPEQLMVLEEVFKRTQRILQDIELRMAAGALPAVPPDMIVLTAMSAVLSGAKRWEVPAKDILSNHLAASCETEAEAHVAVSEAFDGRRKAEEASGVSHGPPERAAEVFGGDDLLPIVVTRPCPICGGAFKELDPAHDPTGSANETARAAWEKRRAGCTMCRGEGVVPK